MFFTSRGDARWNAESQAIEFGVGIGEYEGVVRLPRDAFRRFIDGAVTPDKCIEAYHPAPDAVRDHCGAQTAATAAYR